MNPRSDVHTVTEHGIVGEDDVADVDADAKMKIGVVPERGLDFTRAAHRVHGAMEARQGPVANLADQPPVEKRQQRAQQIAMRRQCSHCLMLVAGHDRRVAGDIAEHDRGQFAFGRRRIRVRGSRH